MTTELRSLSAPPQQPARADPTLAADFAARSGAGEATPGAMNILPAPAAAPEARPAVRLGPAEQAYVRAYFAGSGATP